MCLSYDTCMSTYYFSTGPLHHSMHRIDSKGNGIKIVQTTINATFPNFRVLHLATWILFFNIVFVYTQDTHYRSMD